ncbi:hypothetical protein [Polyangium sp. 6x1]|uniref:hypothetical protein n=1 Tax=Polyangium sp. 6x1 TaxID=3042689 RepID=UPI002482DCA8|nr:hypothetical protein [Polyangium sp. 6x1]MDI1451031.1 hypothetical protein [Polyangium sp. 6x1]
MFGLQRPLARGLLAAALLAACSSGSSTTTEAAPPASGSPGAPPLGSFIAPSPTQPPQPKSPQPNPLGLPPRKIKLDPGRRVFTFSEPMLTNARIGSTLVLYAATAIGFDGDDLVIEGQSGGPSYKVHPGYVIPVPDNVKPKLGDVVLTEWNGVMKHAVVRRYVKDRIAVRYTDMEARAPEGLLKGVRWVKQVNGLEPGNYAAHRQEGEYRHVLLVSPFEGGFGAQDAGGDPKPRASTAGVKRWFCLGFGGAALIADEADLQPIPIKWKGKPGAVVWAEWAGTMRRAVMQSENEPGIFTVKFERAGKPEVVGYGLIMDPL